MRPDSRLFGLLATQERLAESDVPRAMRLVTADGICSMVMGSLQGGPFLTAFALALGASNYEIGLLAAIGFLSQMVQLPALFLVRAFPHRRAITVVSALTSRLAWIFIILIPVLFVRRGTTWLLQWLIVSAVLTSAAAPAWNSLLRDLIPVGRLGRVFALRTVLGNGLALPAMLAGGYLVDWWSERWPGAGLYAYSTIFLLGLGFGLVGVVTIARLPEPDMPSGRGGGLLDLLAEPFRDHNYRQFLVFVALWGAAVNLATPFFATYMLQRLGLPVSTVTTLAVIAQIANLLFLTLWGRLADRFSNKAVIATCAPLYLLAFVAWAFTATPQPHALTMALLVAIHVASGIATAGIGLPIGNLGLKLSPAGSAHAYVTLAGVAGALSGTVAPLVGGALADFFAARELTLRLTWAEPTRHFEFYALRLEALDFLFLIAAVVGLYGLSRLARIEETGEVTERTVMEEALDQVVLPFRTMSTVEGIRRLTFFPLSAIERFRSPRGDHGGRRA